MTQTRRALIFGMGAATALAACGNGVGGAGAATIDARADSTVNQMYSQYPGTRALGQKAAGMLVMPLVTEAGLGFGALVVGSTMPDESGKVALIWFVLAYLLHTTGELCLSPVGLSAVTKLAVPSVVGVMMGAWFLATAYSEFIAAQISKLAAIDLHAGEVLNIDAAREVYANLFDKLLWVGLGTAAVLLVLTPVLKKLMGHAADINPDTVGEELAQEISR